MFPWDRAKKDLADITEAFSEDDQFEVIGLIAHGSYGSATRVRLKDGDTGDSTDFIVKRAFRTDAAEKAMKDERDYLMKLRGALHIVQILEVEDNPLDEELEGEWIMMEWLPNGTVLDLIKKSKGRIKRFPNRLLWRFFLCLIRACIAMADPPDNEDGTVESEIITGPLPDVGIAHSDLHCANVLLGESPDDIEHLISPILKVIDFGRAGEWSFIEFTGTTVHSNLWDIGKLMICLIRLDERSYVANLGNGQVLIPHLGNTITTDGDSILPIDGPDAKYPWLDRDLGKLVCWCLATEPNDRPDLEELSNQVLTHVSLKRASSYPNDPEETDDYVSDIWKRMVHDADT
ncbi:kinase-like domain-containing protein [Daldinia sp. FL1419]|nr:kinase-like domain-containing protein [Daldinia sp. FL1419]